MSKKKTRRFFLEIVNFLSKYWVTLIVVFLIVVVAFSGFRIYQDDIVDSDTRIVFEDKNTLYFAVQKFDTLNPLVSKSEDTYYISKLIYNGLFKYDSDMGVSPDLAESYTVNTEGAYIEIVLKPDIKFHNGKTLKAQDVVFTVNAIRAAGYASPYYKNISKIVSCYATSANSLKIYFSNNYNCSLDDLVFPIVPSNQYSSTYTFIGSKSDFKPVGTGKYRFYQYDSKKQLKLRAFSDYFGEIAEMRLNFVIVPSKDLAYNMMNIKEVTCYIDDAPNRKSQAADKKYACFDFLSNNVDFIVFNTNKGIFNNKQSRQAVLYGIDNDIILSDAYNGDGVLADTIYFPNFYGVTDTHEFYRYDVQKATELLNGIGYIDSNGDGLLEDFSGNALNISILVKKANSKRTLAARDIEKTLESIGIDVEVNSVSDDDFDSMMKAGNYDILLTGYSFSQEYDLRFLFNGKNPWKYNNYTVYELSRELDRLYTADEYREKYSELKENLLDNAVYYPLCYKYQSLIGVQYFEAGKLPSFNNIYNNCESWKWKIEKSTVVEEEDPDDSQND